MKRVAIYGIGEVANFFLDHHDFGEEKIVYFVETECHQEFYRNCKVISVWEIDDSIDLVYVANSFVETVKNLIKKGIEKNKIIICNEKAYHDYLCENNRIKDVLYDEKIALSYEEYWKNVKNRPKYIITETMTNPIQICECNNVQNIFGQRVIVNDDYCRYGTLTLIMEEIENNEVQGELAELGVYRGDFAKCINERFPNRKLYLFDTFEGFDNRDVTEDIEKGFTSKEWFEGWRNFRYTHLDLVMEKMMHKDQCVVRKGYFPDTIPAEELKFALVSLDCDLYEPMLAGLRYFYPRLSKGGYIMIHDYNQVKHLRGVKQAVHDYEAEASEKLVKIPIPDVCGTLVIGK